MLKVVEVLFFRCLTFFRRFPYLLSFTFFQVRLLPVALYLLKALTRLRCFCCFSCLTYLRWFFVSDALLIEIFLLLDVLHSFEILYFLVVLY